VLLLTWDLAGEAIPRLPASADRPFRVIVPLPKHMITTLPVEGSSSVAS
jgi:hypothetical protein